MRKRRIVCFGPGPKFKGGISDYNTSLARALARQPDTQVHIVSWTQQYPSIIPREFIDRSSRVDLLEGSNVRTTYITNYNNPFSWHKTYRYIVSLQPEKVIFQWSLAIQGLPLGRIIKWLKRHPSIELIVDLHFVNQKEDSHLDDLFTRLGISRAHTYIVHSAKTFRELQSMFPTRDFSLVKDGSRVSDGSSTVLQLYHPVYKLFQPLPDFDVQEFKEQLGLKKHVFLFFGFIRKYKGLHNVLRAFRKVVDRRDDVSLLICGESFWATLDQKRLSTKAKNLLFGLARSLLFSSQADERDYQPLRLIEELNLQDFTVVVDRFIPHEQVPHYFQSSDCCVLFYSAATPSGIESLSYNFDLPILATRVGHFPETVEDGLNGYLAEPENVDSMAEQMLRFLDFPLRAEGVRQVAARLNWEFYAQTVLRTKY